MKFKDRLLMHFRRWVLRRVCRDKVLWSIVTGLRGPDNNDGDHKWAFPSRLRYYANGGREISGFDTRCRLLSLPEARALKRPSDAFFNHFLVHMGWAFSGLQAVFPSNGEVVALTDLAYILMGGGHIPSNVLTAVCGESDE